jgi:hypothetical protein
MFPVPGVDPEQDCPIHQRSELKINPAGVFASAQKILGETSMSARVLLCDSGESDRRDDSRLYRAAGKSAP